AHATTIRGAICDFRCHARLVAGDQAIGEREWACAAERAIRKFFYATAAIGLIARDGAVDDCENAPQAVHAATALSRGIAGDRAVLDCDSAVIIIYTATTVGCIARYGAILNGECAAV